MRARSFDGDSSNGRIYIQEKPRFNKKVSNQVHSKFPKAREYRLSNCIPKKGSDTNSPTKNPTCGKCGIKYYGGWLKGMNNYFCCGKTGHKV